MKAKLSSRTIQALIPAKKPFEVVDTELKGFLLRVQPSGAMTYYFAYRNGQGKRQRYRVGNSESLSPAQARDQAVLLSARVVAGEDVQAAKKYERKKAKLAKIQTLEGLLAYQYEPWALSQRKSGAATVKRIRSNFSHLMQRPLKDINLWVIEKWRSQELKRGKSKTTVNRDVTTLKACLSKAVEWDVLESNPLQKLKPLRVEASFRARYLTTAEETRLRDALIERDAQLRKNRVYGNAWRLARHQPLLPDLSTAAFADYLQPMVLLSMNTGVRRGELLQLKWTDVDLVGGKLVVRGNTAKSGKTRHIPLNGEALTTLRCWREDNPVAEWVIAGRDGKPLKGTRTSWKRLLVNAGILGFRWHDLRHHFASRLVMKGVDLNTVRELLGHSDLTMTLRYAHLSPEHKAEAVARLCDTEKSEPPMRAVAHR